MYRYPQVLYFSILCEVEVSVSGPFTPEIHTDTETPTTDPMVEDCRAKAHLSGSWMLLIIVCMLSFAFYSGELCLLFLQHLLFLELVLLLDLVEDPRPLPLLFTRGDRVH